MAITYGKKKQKQNYVLHTLVAVLLICAVFLGMVNYLYSKAEAEAYETLHVQTRQIKDNITLQLISDRENLSTMANFAAKLYSDGESYDLMFASFKPIGLIENIGILNPDNTFVTKAGSVDLNGRISFADEKEKGAYISGREADLTPSNNELIRSAVPIVVDGETVGMLYGVIKPDVIGARYQQMVQEFDAQLFVYDIASGNLVIDTVHQELGNISFLETRTFNDGYSYEKLMTTDKGFVSFQSAYRNENLHLHYSTMEDIGWMIAMGRYDSQVFFATHQLAGTLLIAFVMMIAIIVAYIITLVASEKRLNAVTAAASDVRKILLETSGHEDHIAQALKQVCVSAKSRSAVFFDTNEEDYHYVLPSYQENTLTDADKQFFKAELFRYAAKFHKVSGTTVSIMQIKPNKHLLKTNPSFYEFLTRCKMTDISFAATVNSANHITILAAINSKRSAAARMLGEKVSACFSMALYNKNHLNKTTLAATTDSLTGVVNRVAYNNDLPAYNRDNDRDFSCIYVDVNELHLRNNKYGHAAGDEMLCYIANTLKEVFYGHKVYRMGGDEFLVFVKNTQQDVVKDSIAMFIEQLKPKDYHVAVGMSYRSCNTNTEEMVREAELRMYEVKAAYYQSKGEAKSAPADSDYVQVKTGISEIDTMLSVLKEKYNGIYRVSLDTDRARRILMPAYLQYNEDEEHFSQLFSKYVSESVHSDDHRAMLSFLNYDAIRHQLAQNTVPKISYRKIGGEGVVLSVYRLCDEDEEIYDTLWVFAKE